MRGSRTDLVVAAAVLVAFAVSNIWLARRGLREVSGLEILPVPSVYNGGPSGLRGLYSYWRGLGFDARVWRRPWSRLPQGPAVLVVAAPFLPPGSVDSREARALMQWVRAGHAALLLGGNTDLLAAAGVRPLPGQQTRTPVPPAAPTGLMTGVTSLSLSQDRWLGPLPPVVVHAGDDRGPALLTRLVGRGEVVALADPAALANSHLQEADNAVMAANLAALARGPVYFDEYHHGFRERRSLASILLRPPLLWLTLQVLLAAALFLHAVSRRFGPPVSAGTGSVHRASTEYVAAMASLYQSAAARGLVLERLAQGFRRQVAPALGLPPGAPGEQIAQAAARRGKADAGRVVRALQACEGEVPSRGRPKEGLLLWVGSELETLRRQVLG